MALSKEIYKGCAAIPIKFIETGRLGDFAWMIEEDIKTGEKTLYIFGDGEEIIDGKILKKTKHGGAVIRPYSKVDSNGVQRAFGLPTWSSNEPDGCDKTGAYQSLTPRIKDVIDNRMIILAEVLTASKPTNVCYSCVSSECDTLGAGTYKSSDEVRVYITEMLHQTVADYNRKWGFPVAVREKKEVVAKRPSPSPQLKEKDVVEKRPSPPKREKVVEKRPPPSPQLKEGVVEKRPPPSPQPMSVENRPTPGIVMRRRLGFSKNAGHSETKVVVVFFPHIKLRPVVYLVDGPNPINWATRTDEEAEGILMVFNDNLEDHRNFYVLGIRKSSHHTSGNACVRHNQMGEYPTSIGVPTGTLKNNGFKSVTDKFLDALAVFKNELIRLLQTGRFHTVEYSSKDDEGDILGTGIFKVDPKVGFAIVATIRSIVPKSKKK
jgi:hypothetical protein